MTVAFGTTQSRSGGPRRHVVFALGKPVKPDSVFSDVFDVVRASGVGVTVHLPHTAKPRVPAWFAAADLVVHRGLNRDALAALASLEAAGTSCCNTVASTVTVGNRPELLRRLDAAGVPMPGTCLARDWRSLVEAVGDDAAVIKAVDGSRGRGAGVVITDAGGLPASPPFAGPYVVQERIPHDGRDRKIYVVGDHVRGVLKPSPPRQFPGACDELFTPSPELTAVAKAAREAVGLAVCGVDVLEGPGGPVVVDVNPFPSLGGVPDAARVIGCHVVNLVTGDHLEGCPR